MKTPIEQKSVEVEHMSKFRRALFCTCLSIGFLLAAKIQSAHETPEPKSSSDQERTFRKYTPTDFFENEELREIINNTDAKKVSCAALTTFGAGLSVSLHKRFPTTLLRSVGRSSPLILLPVSCYVLHDHISGQSENNIE
jgi:hypothetical protein